MNIKKGVAALMCAAAGVAQATDLVAVQQQAMMAAEKKISAGQAAQAYDILLPHETALAGHVAFDLMFGQAAMAANHPSRAAFAFDRCLAVDPYQGICRLGMAQAHMMLREVESARKEIRQITDSAPPKEVQAIVQNYLNTLDGLSVDVNAPKLQAYVQFGAGYDTNFNAATSQRALALPLFNDLIFSLSEAGQRRGSVVNQMQAHILYTRPFRQQWQFTAEGDLQGTGYWHTHDYNSLIADVKLGISYKQNTHQAGIKLLGQHYTLGDKTYRNMAGLLGQYDYTVSERARLGTFVQVNQLNYPQEHLRKATRYTAGASWSTILGNQRALTFVSAYGGNERATNQRAPDTLDYRFAGLRLGAMALLGGRVQLEAGGGVERRLYDGREILFLRKRSDSVLDAYVGLNYALDKKTSIRTQYRYIRDISTIPLQDYTRNIFTVSMRYEFF